MNEMSVNEVTINGETYVKKSLIGNTVPAETLDGMRYCMVRTYSAGVFAGYVKSANGKEYTLVNARRIWKWSGAASLSELAMKGSGNPSGCKFPCPVSEVLLTEVIEVIPCTKLAQEFIMKHEEWSANNG